MTNLRIFLNAPRKIIKSLKKDRSNQTELLLYSWDSLELHSSEWRILWIQSKWWCDITCTKFTLQPFVLFCKERIEQLKFWFSWPPFTKSLKESSRCSADTWLYLLKSACQIMNEIFIPLFLFLGVCAMLKNENRVYLGHHIQKVHRCMFIGQMCPMTKLMLIFLIE